MCEIPVTQSALEGERNDPLQLKKKWVSLDSYGQVKDTDLLEYAWVAVAATAAMKRFLNEGIVMSNMLGLE